MDISAQRQQTNDQSVDSCVPPAPKDAFLRLLLISSRLQLNYTHWITETNDMNLRIYDLMSQRWANMVMDSILHVNTCTWNLIYDVTLKGNHKTALAVATAGQSDKG